MHELIFKNYVKSFFLILIGIAAVSGASLTKTGVVEVPIPVYILGILTGFLLIGFIFYSKANIGQTLQIAITGILVNAIFIIGTYFAGSYLNLPRIELKPEFILYMNPVVIGVSFLFSVLVLFVSVGFKKVKTKGAEKTSGKEIGENDGEIPENAPVQRQKDIQETDVVEFNYKKSEEKMPQQEEISSQASEESKSPSTYEELYPQASNYVKADSPQEDDYLEDIMEGDLKEGEGSSEEISEERLPEEVISFSDNGQGEMPEDNENMDYIPTNIRLSEVVSVRDTDSKGKIGSIGKLLVNNRDIENVIKTNEMTNESVLNDRTNVISSISGEKIYKKFSEMKEEFVYIKEVALIDKGGFTLANDFEDKQRAQITGALVAGTYHTLQNYLAQLSMAFPVRIFFETANTNSFIVKTKNEILFSIWDKEFKHIDYGPLTEIIQTEDFSQIDITPYADLMKLDKFTIADSGGKIIKSTNETEQAEQFAAVSTAIFENLKVFLMNIQLLKLSKIVVFTPQKVMTIIKNQDNIISFLTNSEDFPKISEDLLKIEEIY